MCKGPDFIPEERVLNIVLFIENGKKVQKQLRSLPVEVFSKDMLLEANYDKVG